MIRNALTMAETAARLGCSERKVYELLQAGELKRGHSFGRRTLVRLDSIEKLEASVAPRPSPARKSTALPPAANLEEDMRILAEFKKSLRARKP